MGQIVAENAKPKRCNRQALETGGSLAEVVLQNGEYVLVSSDNTVSQSGNGIFDSYVVGDGTTLGKNLPVHNILDKTYDTSVFSGLGHQITPKNIQTISGVEKNVLTQEMINEPNSIYLIQYDFDLNGQTITIPSNCELKFNGGSVTNGNITCNNTLFEGDIHLNEIVLNGTIQNASIDISWFDVKFTSNANEYNAVAAANNTIIANYLFPSCVNIGKTLTLSYIVRISEPISINGFCVDCGFYEFAYHGNAALNGAVVTIAGRNNHIVSVSNYSTSGSFDVRKDYGIIGVDCNGVNTSIINIKLVAGFTTGVRISSTSVGNAYNIYNIGEIRDCYKGLVFYRSGSGYVNENIINKGRIWCSSSSVFSSKNIAISFIKEEGASNYPFNNLTLNQPSVEVAGVAIYANSIVRESRIIDIRDEGAITLVQDDNTDVIAESACIITPYKYYGYTTIYNTFIIKGGILFEKYPNYTTYLKGLIYNEDEKSICFADAFAVDYYAAVGSFYYKKNTGIGNYTQSDITTTNAVNIAMGVGLLFKRKTGNSLMGIIDVSNSSGTASSRFGVIFLKNDMKYFTQDELSGVKTNLGAAKLSSLYTYIYYIVGANTAGGNFSFNNIPSDVTYMMVSAAGTFSKIKMAINDAWELVPPDGVIKIAAKKAKNSYGYLANTPVMYLNNENKLCVFLKDDNGVVTNKYADGTDIPDE